MVQPAPEHQQFSKKRVLSAFLDVFHVEEAKKIICDFGAGPPLWKYVVSVTHPKVENLSWKRLPRKNI